MKLKKAFKNSLFVLAALFLLVFFMGRQYAVGFFKLATGKAFLVEKAFDGNVSVDGQKHEATFYRTTSHVFIKGVEHRNVNSLIVRIRSQSPLQIFKVGGNWIGTFSHGGGGFLPLGDKALLSETAIKSCDIRDDMKSLGLDYKIEKATGVISYWISPNAHVGEIKFSIREDSLK